MVRRAEDEVVRIKALVEDGTLPKSRLTEAQSALADAQDDSILAETLYGGLRVADMTPDETKTMVEAAQRRVDRQQKLLDERQELLDKGILARSEFSVVQDELLSRQRVLELAVDRAKLVEDLKQMAEAERQFEHAAQDRADLRYAMIRYDGNGVFALGALPGISDEFRKRFHHDLPVSALGQTLLHESMGLDHRNRVDVALNPDQTEGIWLREWLETRHIPYLAFRSAVAGAATAPHIHIGAGSTRLRMAAR